MNRFEVGQRVACINDKCKHCGDRPVKGLDYDEIYTVMAVDREYIKIAEHSEGCYDERRGRWHHTRFRPLIIRRVERKRKATAPVPQIKRRTPEKVK